MMRWRIHLKVVCDCGKGFMCGKEWWSKKLSWLMWTDRSVTYKPKASA